jgi:hypothetical protein
MGLSQQVEDPDTIISSIQSCSDMARMSVEESVGKHSITIPAYLPKWLHFLVVLQVRNMMQMVLSFGMPDMGAALLATTSTAATA